MADLDAWLAEARACSIAAVETFTARLEQGGAAVRTALTEPWSSSEAERRQSYGRAGFDLLRRRVLMAA